MSSKNIGETSYKETAFGIIPRSKLIPLEIEGIKRAWDFVLEKSQDGKISITSTLLKKIHAIGFSWIFPELGGKFRRIEVAVSQHTPPKFYLVPQQTEDFLRDLKVRTSHLPNLNNSEFMDALIELLAWAHHRFLWIHPFQDYNGRIARLLTNIILLNLNLPPIELKVETEAGRKKYVAALQEGDKGNFKKLEELIKSALEEAAMELSLKSKK